MPYGKFEKKVAMPKSDNSKKSWSITHSDITVPTGKTRIQNKVKITKNKNVRPENPEWDREMLSDTPTSKQGDLLITSIRQNWELQLVKDIEVARAEGQSSKTWLENHSLAALNLTLEDIMKEGIPVKPPSGLDSGTVCQHLKFYNSVLNEFESQLKRFLTICQERIRWLLRDSRRAFGLVTGSRPCILLDVSDTNTGFGRLSLIQDSLKQFVGEQLAKKEKMYVCSFGTDVQPLWNTARDINCRIVEEMHHWIDCLQPEGGCNVMSAVRQVVKRTDIDSVILILGNCPDQNPQTIIDYVHESVVGRLLPFHTVAYNCSITATNMFLDELAKATQGRYHCYSATNEADIMSGTDLQLLSQEIRKTVHVLSQINDMRSGAVVENRVVSIADQPCLELQPVVQGKEIQKYHGNTVALAVEQPSFPVRTSKEWLSEHSLKAKGLTLYQVMAPNAFNYVNGYISSINRSVASQVHHRSMVQLQWHDGSTKNVHVDPVTLSSYQQGIVIICPSPPSCNRLLAKFDVAELPRRFEVLYEYCKQKPIKVEARKEVIETCKEAVKLNRVREINQSKKQRHLDVALQLYRRRMEWLTTGSRNTFGTLVEKRAVVLVDMSLGMSGDMMRIHDDMRSLLEQQIPSKDLFNIICFGSTAVPFQPRMVEATPINIESAFRWFIRQTCSGSRKFMDAFRTAIENEEERKEGVEVDGVYLITSGIPDEPKDVACAYVQEAFVGRDASFHCIFYEPEGSDLPPVAGRYANVESTAAYLKDLAHGARGRFHWIKENDIMESDDVRLVSDEIDKAHNYKKKVEVLLETLRQRYTKGESTEQLDSSELVPRPPTSGKKRIGPPRQTALSQARINGVRPASAKLATSNKKKTRSRPHSATNPSEDIKSLSWKPSTVSSTTNLIPPLSSSEENLSTSKLRPSKHQIKAEQQTFYTEVGNETGYVFRSYQVPTNPVSKKKLLPTSTKVIPESEDNISTKEWLRKYSLSKLKLDLNSAVNSTDCAHSPSKISTLGKSVNAKYCEIFPTVSLNGAMKHLHLQPKELEEYEDKLEAVLKRYVKRLQWLLSGSRKVFGSIIEQNVILLVDVSGSMVTNIDELKKELGVIIWEQIHANDINFNIMKYSSEPVLWKRNLVKPEEEHCKEAIDWISNFEAYGGTCTIDALRLAFEVENLDAIYLLSDGKPDTSTTSVLREVATLCSVKKLKIHTISFNCEDNIANRFLQLLATQTGARYLRYQSSSDIEVSTHKLLSKDYNDENCENLPLFEGDDARRLLKEIKLCRQYLSHSRSYRDLYKGHTSYSSKMEQSSRITIKDFTTVGAHKNAKRMTEVA